MGVPLMHDKVFAWFWIAVLSLIGAGLVATAFFSRGPIL